MIQLYLISIRNKSYGLYYIFKTKSISPNREYKWSVCFFFVSQGYPHPSPVCQGWLISFCSKVPYRVNSWLVNSLHSQELGIKPPTTCLRDESTYHSCQPARLMASLVSRKIVRKRKVRGFMVICIFPGPTTFSLHVTFFLNLTNFTLTILSTFHLYSFHFSFIHFLFLPLSFSS